MKKSLFMLFFAVAAGLFARDFVRENPEKYWDTDLLKIKAEYREAPFADSKFDG